MFHPNTVGRLPRDKEFDSVEEFAAAIVKALEAQSSSTTTTTSITRLSYATTTASYFWETFAKKGVPVVLTGAAQEMGYGMDKWSAEGLNSSYPDYPISLRDAGEKKGDYDKVTTTETTLHEYMNSNTSTPPNNKIIQQHVNV